MTGEQAYLFAYWKGLPRREIGTGVQPLSADLGQQHIRDLAAAEAQHFLSVAKPVSGDLVPVLDLESNDRGLPVARLKAWVQSWLDSRASRAAASAILECAPAFSSAGPD